MVRHYLCIVMLFLSLAAQAIAGDSYNIARLYPVTPFEAPQLKLAALNSDNTVLVQYQGKITLVHFWATWCIACRKEFPQLQQLGKELGNSGLQIITVAADNHEDTYQYKLDHNLLLTILVDQYGKALKDFSVKALPTTFVIDRNGVMHYQAAGRVDWEKREVRKLIRDFVYSTRTR